MRKRVLSGKTKLATFISIFGTWRDMGIFKSSMAGYDAIITPSITTTAPKLVTD